MMASQQQNHTSRKHGSFDVQVCDGGEANLHKHFNSCEKNPGHTDFIPVNSFSKQHLPLDFQDDEFVERIRALSGLTVLVSVRHVSVNRPQTWPDSDNVYPHYSDIGSDKLRTGSGWVYKVVINNSKPCTCTCEPCLRSSTPELKFAKITIITAAHVVFDETEAAHTTCHLFFDSGSTLEACSEVVRLTGMSKVSSDMGWDLCKMKHVTHDLNLAYKLDQMVKKVSHITRESFDLLLISDNRPQKRPDSDNVYPQHNDIDRDMLRNGTGWVEKVVINNNKSCICETCLRSSTPETKFAEITIKRMSEISRKFGWDFLKLKYITHDLDLAERLKRTEKKIYHMPKEEFDQLLIKPNLLTVVVSHPHGCSKHVSIGWCKKIDMKDNDIAQFTYDTATCPGSSGARVFMMTSNFTWPRLYHVHMGTWSGSEQQNHSGDGYFMQPQDESIYASASLLVDMTTVFSTNSHNVYLQQSFRLSHLYFQDSVTKILRVVLNEVQCRDIKSGSHTLRKFLHELIIAVDQVHRRRDEKYVSVILRIALENVRSRVEESVSDTLSIILDEVCKRDEKSVFDRLSIALDEVRSRDERYVSDTLSNIMNDIFRRDEKYVSDTLRVVLNEAYSRDKQHVYQILSIVLDEARTKDKKSMTDASRIVMDEVYRSHEKSVSDILSIVMDKVHRRDKKYVSNTLRIVLDEVRQRYEKYVSDTLRIALDEVGRRDEKPVSDTLRIVMDEVCRIGEEYVSETLTIALDKVCQRDEKYVFDTLRIFMDEVCRREEKHVPDRLRIDLNEVRIPDEQSVSDTSRIALDEVHSRDEKSVSDILRIIMDDFHRKDEESVYTLIINLGEEVHSRDEKSVLDALRIILEEVSRRYEKSEFDTLKIALYMVCSTDEKYVSDKLRIGLEKFPVIRSLIAKHKA